jgi:membrane fusion protein, multidrug efflux system
MAILPPQARQFKGKFTWASIHGEPARFFSQVLPAVLAGLVVVSCLGLLSALTACSARTSTKTSRTAVPPLVVVTPLQPHTIPIYTEYVGQTEAVNTVEIHSQVQGLLQQIAFREGSIVRKGQLLFVIDPRPYQASLQEAEALRAVQQETANNAQTIVNRYTPLTQQHALSQQQLDSAVAAAKEDQAQVQSAQAQVDAAQLNLNYTRITAPMSGVIGISQVKVGDLIQSGTTLMSTIYSISPMYVTFAISQSDYLAYAKRRREQPKQTHPIQLILGDGTTYAHAGTVDMAAPTVSTTTGTLSIRATFPNPEGLLKPGLFGRVRFVAKNATNVLLVPLSAIQQLQGTQSVFVVGPDNRVQQKTITTGATVNNMEIVNSGLQVGDRIIVEGTQKVQPGMEVRAQEIPEQIPSATTNTENSGRATSSQSSPATPADSSAAKTTRDR